MVGRSLKMQLKFILATSAAFATSVVTVVAQDDDGFCYDTEQYTTKFSDLGSKQVITQALNETCSPPIGDQIYACNAAVSTHARKQASESNQVLFISHVLRYPIAPRNEGT